MIRAFAFLMCMAAPTLAAAEYCWMLGCENLVGYVPLSKPASKGTADIFGRTKVPRPGTDVTLAEYVYLRDHPHLDEGPYILAPGTIVKVLDIVTTPNKRKFAVIRILEDRNSRREECRMTINCTAIFY